MKYIHRNPHALLSDSAVRFFLFCLVAILTLSSPDWSRAKHPDLCSTLDSQITEVNQHWHNAGLNEAKHDAASAEQEYLTVIEKAEPLSSHIREWFIGTAELGIARCEARSGNVSATKLAVYAALAHHFWNFDILRMDPSISKVTGTQWLDSTITRWEKIRSNEEQQWHSQRPILLFPNGYTPNSTRPLLVALHGGNASYEQFAEHWRKIANAENIVVAIPAGPVRISQITNSWSESFDENDRIVQRLIDTLVAEHMVDGSQIYVAGFSQGAEQALEIILVHPNQFRGALLVSGFIQQNVPIEMLSSAAEEHVNIYAVCGEYDAKKLYSSLADLSQRAGHVGLSFDLVKSPGMIHEVPLDLDKRFHDIWLRLKGAGRSITGAALPGVEEQVQTTPTSKH
jgi:predicted esterase